MVDRIEILRKLRDNLKAITGVNADLDKEEASDNEAIKLAMFATGLTDVTDALKDISLSSEDVLKALSNIKIDAPTIPEITIPEIKLPTITVPDITVNVPEVKIPTIVIPEIKLPTINVPEPKVTVNIPKADAPIVTIPDEMNVQGSVAITNTVDNPVPTRLVDSKGNDVQLGGSSGGGVRNVKSTSLNAEGQAINPATEEKQDSILTAVSIPTDIAHELVTVTTAGTRVQFATTTVKSITVKALATNTGIIYVGKSTVSSANGFPLASGDTVSLDISNTDIVWVDSSVNGEKCNWIANI